MGEVFIFCLFFSLCVMCVTEGEREYICGDVWLQISIIVCVCESVFQFNPEPDRRNSFHHRRLCILDGWGQTEKEKIDMLYTHNCWEKGIVWPSRSIRLVYSSAHLLVRMLLRQGIRFVIKMKTCAKSITLQSRLQLQSQNNATDCEPRLNWGRCVWERSTGFPIGVCSDTLIGCSDSARVCVQHVNIRKKSWKQEVLVSSSFISCFYTILDQK